MFSLMNKITKQEFYYWLDCEIEGLKPKWLADVMYFYINKECNQQCMSDLRSEIKQASKDSKEAAQ